MWHWGPIWVDSFVAIVEGSEQLDEVVSNLGCLCNQTLLGKFVFTFCGPWHCFQVRCVLNLQVFGGFLTWPLHHAVDIELECMSWTLDLWLQWTCLGRTSWPTNKGCEFCDQRCAHSSCGNCEKLGEKSCWILELRVVVSLSFTWCYESFGGGVPSIPKDGKLWWIILETHCNDQGPILLPQKDWA